jgi:hypothetical protein
MRVSHKKHSEIESIQSLKVERMDLTPVHAHISKHEEYLRYLSERIDRMSPIYTELEMQRRALVAIKAQRDIDRNRRLMFIKRVRKERDEAQRLNFKLKLAVGASFILTLFTVIR